MCTVSFENYICPQKKVLVEGVLGFQEWRVWAAIFGRRNIDTETLCEYLEKVIFNSMRVSGHLSSSTGTVAVALLHSGTGYIGEETL